MKYQILENLSPQELTADVENCLDLGWRPQGGVAILHRTWMNDLKGFEEEETIFYQAMVKNEVVIKKEEIK